MHNPLVLYTPGSVKGGVGVGCGGIMILSRRSIQSGEALGSVCRLDYPGRRRDLIVLNEPTLVWLGCRVNRQMENVDTHCTH